MTYLMYQNFYLLFLYADDTCVLMNGKHLEELVTRMQNELKLALYLVTS